MQSTCNPLIYTESLPLPEVAVLYGQYGAAVLCGWTSAAALTTMPRRVLRNLASHLTAPVVVGLVADELAASPAAAEAVVVPYHAAFSRVTPKMRQEMFDQGFTIVDDMVEPELLARLIGDARRCVQEAYDSDDQVRFQPLFSLFLVAFRGGVFFYACRFVTGARCGNGGWPFLSPSLGLIFGGMRAEPARRARAQGAG